MVTAEDKVVEVVIEAVVEMANKLAHEAEELWDTGEVSKVAFADWVEGYGRLRWGEIAKWN